MHPTQIIFLALMGLAFIGGWIRAPRKMLGGTIGGVLGIAIPALCAAIYVRRGGDPTAAGVFSFFCILTVPLGAAIGVFVATRIPKRREVSDKNTGK